MDWVLTFISKYAIIHSMKICNYENCVEAVKFKQTCYKHTSLIKRQRRRAELINLLGGKCVNCGATDNIEFDHIDPSTKSFNISEGLARKLEGLLAEASKCQLLCRDCHISKSISQIDMRAIRKEYVKPDYKADYDIGSLNFSDIRAIL